MKKISILLLGLTTALSLSSCMDNFDDDDWSASDADVTSPVSIGATNSTIARLKSENRALFNSKQDFARVDSDLIIEGVVCGNDAGNNLYQTLLIRDTDTAAGTDQCIEIGLRQSGLYPYFPLGQRIKINLNGLYIGCYSTVPKIGQPYYTTAGNLRLGAIVMDYARTHIEKIGTPNPNAPELVPINLANDEGDAWLRASANRTCDNCPILAIVRGSIREVNAANKDKAESGTLETGTEPLPKLFGPKVLRDAGWAVNRTLELQSNNTSVTLRTSTSCPMAYYPIPEDTRNYTGVLTYYGSDWQLSTRGVEDVYPALEEPIEHPDATDPAVAVPADE